MRDRIFSILSVLGIVVCAGTAAGQAPSTFEEVVAALDKMQADRADWQADVEVQMTVGPRAIAFTGVTKNEGDLSRTEMKLEMGGQVSDVVTVTDADQVQWTEIQRGGGKQVLKIDMKRLAEVLGPEVLENMSMGQGPATPIDVRQSASELLASYKDSFDLTYLGTGTYSDAKVYLIEGTRREDAEGSAGIPPELEQAGIRIHELKLAIGTEDGFLRSLEWFGEEHQPIMKVVYENVIIGPTFPDGQFSYTPAAGARVMDMTPMMEQQLRRQQR